MTDDNARQNNQADYNRHFLLDEAVTAEELVRVVGLFSSFEAFLTSKGVGIASTLG